MEALNFQLPTVTLEENKYTSAEIYADEVPLNEPYPPDQRINMGWWVLISLLQDWVASLPDRPSDSKKFKEVPAEPIANFLPSPLALQNQFVVISESTTEKTSPIARFSGNVTPALFPQITDAMPLWMVKSVKKVKLDVL
jgi:hypothetical protein